MTTGMQIHLPRLEVQCYRGLKYVLLARFVQKKGFVLRETKDSVHLECDVPPEVTDPCGGRPEAVSCIWPGSGLVDPPLRRRLGTSCVVRDLLVKETRPCC